VSQSIENADHAAAQKKRMLLAEMLQRRAGQPRSRPLSQGQERIWLLSRLNPDKPIYNISVAYHLTGPLEERALEHALVGIAQRHEVLRTTFQLVDGQPMQTIGPEAGSPLETVDLRTLPEPERRSTALRLTSEQAEVIFDLERGPLWRAKLIRLEDQAHILVLTMHHIVSDGWSFEVVCQELKSLYAAAGAGQSFSLPSLQIQYADLAQRQRQSPGEAAYEEQLAYWTTCLRGKMSALLLPIDRRPPVATTHRAARESLAIPPELSRALASLSQRENCSLFMTLLAAFQAVLFQHTQQQDMMICSPVIGRQRPQSRALVGYFNNILPLRFDLGGDPSLLALVRRTRAVALDGYRNQDVPFQAVVRATGLRNIPLSRALFSVDMVWPPELTLGSCASRAEDLETGACDFDLSISMWEAQGRLSGNIRYKTELFDAKTIKELIVRYGKVLEHLATNADVRLSALPSYGKPHHRAAVDEQRPASRYWPPDTETEIQVMEIWKELLGNDRISVDDDLLALGASSLAIAQISERLQKTFNKSLPLTALFQARTVEQIAALLEANEPSRARPALTALQPEGTRPPLFLCEGVGLYYPLTRWLGKDQPVYGLITEVTEKYGDISGVAARYVREIEQLQPVGPYHLGGASFGGIVAFEVAQQLIAKGHEIAFLGLFDTPGPGAYRPKPFVRRLIGHLRETRDHGLPYLLKKLRRLVARFKSAFNPFFKPAQERLPILQGKELRGEFGRLAGEYELKPYAGKITLFTLGERGGLIDSLFNPALGDIDPHLGWGRIAAAGVDVHEVPGDHITIFHEPHVRILGEKLRACLDRLH